MQPPTLSSSQNSALPFVQEKYTGEVNVSILKDSNSSAIYIRVIGKRITLESFQGQYTSSLKTIFGDEIVADRDELRDLTSIFGSKTGMQNYGECGSEEEKKILGRIEKDASRPYQGDVFTGFAVTDNAQGKIIGRISLGSGYEPGESQSGLIIEESYRGKGYGKEAICLAAALAFVFYQNQYQVGDNGEKAPVNRFTATALDSNHDLIELITKTGLKYMRTLKQEENYSDHPRCLYGIEGDKVSDKLEKFLDKSKFTWKVSCI